jgi:hypothetical protein
MESGIIKKDNQKFVGHFPVTPSSMGWYFSSVPPGDSIMLPAGRWTCMFKHIDDVAKGKRIAFSEKSAGCSGASCYFGFKQPQEILNIQKI